MKKRSLLVLAAAVAAGCSVGNFELEEGSVHRGDIDRAVGNVEIGADCRVEGDVQLTAGNLEIGRRSVITGTIAVDHGNVEMDDEAQAGAVEIKNGHLELGEAVEIGGPVNLANGMIEVRGARVGGPVTLVRGRLEVYSGSELAAGLQVEVTGTASWDSTVVFIHGGSRVAGQVITRGVVTLVVETTADVADAEFVGNAPLYQ